MFRVTVKHGYVATFDDEDRPLFESRRWNLMQSKKQRERGDTGYLSWSYWESGKVNTKTFHGIIFPAPDGMHVDHINGDKLDNRRSNLRHVTQRQNRRAFKLLELNKTSKYRGVCFAKRRAHLPNPWLSEIKVRAPGGKKDYYYLGYFATEEAAGLAYNAKARTLGYTEEALNKIV